MGLGLSLSLNPSCPWRSDTAQQVTKDEGDPLLRGWGIRSTCAYPQGREVWPGPQSEGGGLQEDRGRGWGWGCGGPA